MKVPFGGVILVIFLCSEMVSFKPTSFVTSKKTAHVMSPFPTKIQVSSSSQCAVTVLLFLY
jgi:hypothetical protein